MEENINEYEKVVKTSDENKRQKYWNMAIGLNQVDNLTPSNELECDLVSTRIVELLNDNSFVLNPISFKNIHKYLFKDIYDFAGSYRTYNITKDEPVLNGDTVNYAPYHLIEDSLEYDFENEKKFDYSKLSMNDKIKHIVDFTL